MIIIIAALIGIDRAERAPEFQREAQVSATIVRGHEISARNWKPSSQPNQREIIRREKGGQITLIRLTEFE